MRDTLDRFLTDGPFTYAPGYVVPFTSFYRRFQQSLDLASSVFWHPNKLAQHLPVASLPDGARVVANFNGPNGMQFADRELIIWRGFVAPRDLSDDECLALSRVSRRRSA